MNTYLSPLADIAAQIQALLSTHLLSLVVAVPLVVLLFMLFTVRGGEPVAEAAPAPRAAVPAAPPAVLIVDDSAVVRAKLAKLFAGNGYQVSAARDGVEAMEALAQSFYSVLVTDLEMPNMNGLELIAAIQGSLETEDLPIIAITGHDELQARVHEFGGLYGIFKKPWNDRELLKRVETLATLRARPAPVAATARSAPAAHA